jgi:hypothetical protein
MPSLVRKFVIRQLFKLVRKYGTAFVLRCFIDLLEKSKPNEERDKQLIVDLEASLAKYKAAKSAPPKEEEPPEEEEPEDGESESTKLIRRAHGMTMQDLTVCMNELGQKPTKK